MKFPALSFALLLTGAVAHDSHKASISSKRRLSREFMQAMREPAIAAARKKGRAEKIRKLHEDLMKNSRHLANNYQNYQQNAANNQNGQYQWNNQNQYQQNNQNQNQNQQQNQNQNQYMDANGYWMNGAYFAWEQAPFDMTSRAFKYSGCAAIKTYDQERAAETGDPMVIDTYAVFRLCPADKCNDYSMTGCSKNYGEYAVEMKTYLSYILGYYDDRFDEYCDYCEPCDWEYQAESKSSINSCYALIAQEQYFMQQQQYQDMYNNQAQDNANGNAAYQNGQGYYNYNQYYNAANANKYNNNVNYNGNANNQANANGDANNQANGNGNANNQANGNGDANNQAENANDGANRQLNYYANGGYYGGNNAVNGGYYGGNNAANQNNQYNQNRQNQQGQNGAQQQDYSKYQWYRQYQQNQQNMYQQNGQQYQYQQNGQNVNQNAQAYGYYDENGDWVDGVGGAQNQFGYWGQDGNFYPYQNQQYQDNLFTQLYQCQDGSTCDFCTSQNELQFDYCDDYICGDYYTYCSDLYGQQQDNFDPMDFLECAEWQNVYGQKYYIAPHCGSDHYTISLGVFSDENCLNYIGEDVSLSTVLGFQYSDQDIFKLPKECISCDGAEEYEQNQNNQAGNEGRYGAYVSKPQTTTDGIVAMCSALYSGSAQCNMNMNNFEQISRYMSQYEIDQEARYCAFIENILYGAYDESGEIMLRPEQFDFADWRNPHQYKKLRMSVGQAVGLSMSIILCVALLAAAAVTNRQLTRQSTPWKPKRDSSLARQNSGIVMGRSRSGPGAAPLI